MNASHHTCPSCEGAIPLDDIHVQNDVALCRTCGTTHPFSGLTSGRTLDSVDLRARPRNIRATAGVGGRTIVTYRRVSPLALFLVPFTLVWAGGSMGTIYGSQIASAEFDLALSLFGLPFLFGSLVLVSVTAYALFGKTSITIHRGEASLFHGVGRIGRTRRFRCDRGTDVRLDASTTRVNGVSQDVIVVSDSSGARVAFGALMKDESKRWLAAFLRQQVDGGGRGARSF